MRAAALLVLFFFGCAPAQRIEPIPDLDRDVFLRDVEPILERRCSDPTCHGRPERALSIYAPLRWRTDPARTHIPEALGPGELEHNYVSACLMSSLLARKPLVDGGLYHGGGAEWDDGDPSYRAIVRWSSGASR